MKNNKLEELTRELRKLEVRANTYRELLKKEENEKTRMLLLTCEMDIAYCEDRLQWQCLVSQEIIIDENAKSFLGDRDETIIKYAGMKFRINDKVLLESFMCLLDRIGFTLKDMEELEDKVNDALYKEELKARKEMFEEE